MRDTGHVELNIGHSIIAQAVFSGLAQTVKDLKQIMRNARFMQGCPARHLRVNANPLQADLCNRTLDLRNTSDTGILSIDPGR